MRVSLLDRYHLLRPLSLFFHSPSRSCSSSYRGSPFRPPLPRRPSSSSRPPTRRGPEVSKTRYVRSFRRRCRTMRTIVPVLSAISILRPGTISLRKPPGVHRQRVRRVQRTVSPERGLTSAARDIPDIPRGRINSSESRTSAPGNLVGFIVRARRAQMRFHPPRTSTEMHSTATRGSYLGSLVARADDGYELPFLPRVSCTLSPSRSVSFRKGRRRDRRGWWDRRSASSERTRPRYLSASTHPPGRTSLSAARNHNGP